MSGWYSLLGKSKQECATAQIVVGAGLDFASATVKQYSDGAVFYNFYDKGIAFGFLKDGTLDSIDFYSDKTTGGARSMSTVADSVELPHGITKHDRGRDLVAKFGEPLEKGGGFSAKIDVWLRWQDFQVELDNKSWDAAPNSRWTALTIFK